MYEYFEFFFFFFSVFSVESTTCCAVVRTPIPLICKYFNNVVVRCKTFNYNWAFAKRINISHCDILSNTLVQYI